MWKIKWSYISDDLYNDITHKAEVIDILKSVPDTCMRFPGMKTLEDAIAEIRAIGEDKVADCIA